jgi:hypothetical protein
MRWFIVSLVAIFIAVAPSRAADTAKVAKVLPQYLDLKGRTSISPSLYERDVYQAKLLQNPDMRSGLVFNVLWKSGKVEKPLKLRVEARGVLRGKSASTVTQEKAVTHAGTFGSWEKFTVTGDDFKNLETLTAWRATLWDGDTQLSEYKSHLW